MLTRTGLQAEYDLEKKARPTLRRNLNSTTDDFWLWVEAHAGDDPSRLRLKYGSAREDEIRQIECRRKYARKLAYTLGACQRFYFPTALSGEQSTSDRLAAYHASLVIEGGTAADLTSGLGVDALHIARVASHVTAVERDMAVAEALGLNAVEMGVGNIDVICGDCREYIAVGKSVDTAFIDPARRAADGGRVYALDMCEPDIVAMLPQLERFCRRLVVKMSPMLDISHTLGLLPAGTRMLVLGTATECKELIAVTDFDGKADDEVTHSAVTLLPDGREVVFGFSAHKEAVAEVRYDEPEVGGYLYEPYPAAMKAGAAKLLGARFGLSKFHQNTHLYHSLELVSDFPGDVFRIVEVLPFQSKHIKRLRSRWPKISVTTRNFGITADALRARLAVKDGGEARLFAVTAVDGERLMVVVEGIASRG